jgi:hypothetical protein
VEVVVLLEATPTAVNVVTVAAVAVLVVLAPVQGRV